MPVDIKNLEQSIFEAQRFLKRAKLCLNDFKDIKDCDSKYTAAVRRASMDLTRSLADLRRY